MSIPHCGLTQDHDEHPMSTQDGEVRCVGKLVNELTTEQKVNELHAFVIGELKPLLQALAENPMALMSGGMGGMPQMPPPPVRSRR